jgi:hypothetical protein
MDGFTQELLALAYQTCKQRRGTDVTVANVGHQLMRHWVNYRDGTIAEWAAWIGSGVPHAGLAAELSTIFALLAEAGVHWPWPESDAEEQAAWAAAWGLATLWWLRRELAGRVPVPRCTDEDVGAWLAGQETYQLPLWSHLT